MRKAVSIWLLIVGLMLLLTAPAPAAAEQRVEGRVLRTKITICELKPRGCAGFMVLETHHQRESDEVTIQVPLGVPIRNEDIYVYLPALDGSVVSVTYVTERGVIIARSIEVITGASR